MSQAPLPRRGFVGLQVAALPSPDGAPGLVIRGVALGSAAAQAGVQNGDRLVSLGGLACQSLDQVRDHLRKLSAGAALRLEVLRSSERLVLSATVNPFPREQHEYGEVLLGEVRVGEQRLRTLALVPDGAGPHPVVYYLAGAHWASEEYALDLEQPVPALLGELARQGIASLRVERAGMGDSEGPPCTELDFEHEYRGYLAGCRLLAEASWCDPNRVVLLGHSIGAVVAPLLATERERVLDFRGIATYGASAIPIVDGLTEALDRYAQIERSASPLAVARQCELIRLIVADGHTPAEALRLRPDLQAFAPSHISAGAIYRRNVSFYHQVQALELATAWSRVGCPTLAVHGAQDWVTSLHDSERIAELSGGRALRAEHADHQLAQTTALTSALVPANERRLATSLRKLLPQWVLETCRA